MHKDRSLPKILKWCNNQPEAEHVRTRWITSHDNQNILLRSCTCTLEIGVSWWVRMSWIRSRSETEECCGCRTTEFGGELRWNRTCFKERNFLKRIERDIVCYRCVITSVISSVKFLFSRNRVAYSRKSAHRSRSEAYTYGRNNITL